MTGYLVSSLFIAPLPYFLLCSLSYILLYTQGLSAQLSVGTGANDANIKVPY